MKGMWSYRRVLFCRMPWIINGSAFQSVFWENDTYGDGQGELIWIYRFLEQRSAMIQRKQNVSLRNVGSRFSLLIWKKKGECRPVDGVLRTDRAGRRDWVRANLIRLPRQMADWKIWSTGRARIRICLCSLSTLQRKINLRIRVVVSVSPQFFGWLTGIGSGMRIVRPEDVKQQYKEYLQNVIQNY